MTSHPGPAPVASVAVTVHCTIPLNPSTAAPGGDTDDVHQDVTRSIAEAIEDGRLGRAVRTSMPAWTTAGATVQITAGRVTVAPDPTREHHTGTPWSVRPTVLLLPIAPDTDRTYRALMEAHIPSRPGWLCTLCATPWPCPIRQAEFTAASHTGRAQSVGLTLSIALIHAWRDQPDACPGCLFDQIIGWTDRPAPHPAGVGRLPLTDAKPPHTPRCPAIPPARTTATATSHAAATGDVR